MNQRWVVGVVVWGVAWAPMIVHAAEHGGQEHGGSTTAPTQPAPTAATKEHGGTTHKHGGKAVSAKPSAEQIRQTIQSYVRQSYVQGIAQKKGAFTIKDPVTGTTRRLEFVRVHERVGKTGNYYYSCTDMRDANTGELLDLDFDVEAKAGMLDVVDVRIHKVNGKPRYTYDDKDNRIPL